jgi:hypothetical protein
MNKSRGAQRIHYSDLGLGSCGPAGFGLRVWLSAATSNTSLGDATGESGVIVDDDDDDVDDNVDVDNDDSSSDIGDDGASHSHV